MKYKDMICSIKGYREISCTLDWCVRLQHSSVTDHTNDAAHKAAFDKHLCSKGLNPRDRTEKEHHLIEQARRKSTIQCVENMNKKGLAETKLKFGSPSFLAKKETPLS